MTCRVREQLIRVASARLVAMTVIGAVGLSGACTAQTPAAAPSPSGTVVSELDAHIASVIEAKDGTFWFASRENGLFRHDGQRLLRYTTADGLASNGIGGVHQDRAGNIIVVSGSNSFSRFDGTRFKTVVVKEGLDATWRLHPDDLWFSAGQNGGGVYRFDGEAVHLLKFPATKAGDQHYVEVPRDKFPNAKYTPYDVYTMLKDSRGHLWFGTATLGVCRYDGKTLAWADQTEIGFPAGDAFGVRGIVEDKEGRFWFSLTGSRYEVLPEVAPGKPGAAPAPAGAPVTAALQLTKGRGVGPRDPIVAFVSAHRDPRGDVWFATLGDGVYRYDGHATEHFPVMGHDGKPVWIYSMYRDSQGGLWVCTQGAGVQRLSGRRFVKFVP